MTTRLVASGLLEATPIERVILPVISERYFSATLSSLLHAVKVTHAIVMQIKATAAIGYFFINKTACVGDISVAILSAL